MITEDERFIKIQGILTMSDIHPADCIKINDLIIELSKTSQQLKEVIEEVRKYVTNHSLYEEEYDYDYEENSYLSGIDDETATNDILQILDKAKENK